jgi:hypothetical protein
MIGAAMIAQELQIGHSATGQKAANEAEGEHDGGNNQEKGPFCTHASLRGSFSG